MIIKAVSFELDTAGYVRLGRFDAHFSRAPGAPLWARPLRSRRGITLFLGSRTVAVGW